MTTNHTPTPWHIRETPESSHQEAVIHGGKYVIASVDRTADATHIVTCVNALTGIVARVAELEAALALVADNSVAMSHALRGLVDAVGADGHARLNYWPEMKAAWAALADSTQVKHCPHGRNLVADCIVCCEQLGPNGITADPRAALAKGAA